MNMAETIPDDGALEKSQSLSGHPGERPVSRRGRAPRKPRKPRTPKAEPRRKDISSGGARSIPETSAPIERRWEVLVHLSARLNDWERAFVEDMGRPKWWRGSRLRITSRQQALLAKIYAKTRRQIVVD